MRILLLPMLLAVACQSPSKNKDRDDSSLDDSGLGMEAPARGPLSIAVDGDPNGLWWANGTLFLADDDNNRILRWTDSDGLGLQGELPAAPADGAGLGQLVQLDDGTLVVTRFGYGTAGDVVTLSASGQGAVVPGLEGERRRIGLAVAPDGALYDGWFVSGDAGRVGAISRLSLSGEEQTILDGLRKPVGVLVVGDQLYVADQDAGQILAAPLATPSAVSVLALVDSPDLLCAGPSGSLFTGGKDGMVRRILADGTVETLASGHQEIRGVAYDAENGRLFFVDHDGDDSDGENNFLQILPVEPEA